VEMKREHTDCFHSAHFSLLERKQLHVQHCS
jgi:hypothetical protein